MGRESDGVIKLTSGDLEKSDQGHLLKNTVSVRDNNNNNNNNLVWWHCHRVTPYKM